MKRIISLIVVVAACSEPSTSPHQQLTLAATVAPAIAHIGEPIQIRMVLRNGGASSVVLQGPDCGIGFEVLSSGAVVGPGPTACALIAQEPRTLAAGDSIVVNVPWYGGTRTTADALSQPLSPGRYNIRGIMRLGSTILTSDAGTIELRVTPQNP